MVTFINQSSVNPSLSGFYQVFLTVNLQTIMNSYAFKEQSAISAGKVVLTREEKIIMTYNEAHERHNIVNPLFHSQLTGWSWSAGTSDERMIFAMYFHKFKSDVLHEDVV